ncbi:MAG: UDP-N-acetylmuramoyl-tripeptide--D-alanyl-D-alanine ligase [Actinobacteria bacterium]|nr:UDP-N-acetylmuramoyl-tripeptide--D-alanyl-D-alanine ligase [Actinomycetota bacterium]
MRLDGRAIAAATGAEALAEGAPSPPRRATIDSSQTGPGDLFFGLRGEHRDGGEFAESALAGEAWGVVIGPDHAAALASSGLAGGAGAIADMAPPAWVFAAEDPLAAMQRLANAWRRALGARVVGVTGSVGKTSVKDIARALLPGRVHANRENLNTEIGLPLTVLEAPDDTDTLVLEMAMRGVGQIAELAQIAEPDVAVITNVGPVHVELLGSVAAIAAAKAEILDSLRPGGTAVVPVAAAELEPHLERAGKLLRFGPGGDVRVVESRVVEGVTEATIATPLGQQRFELPFAEAHNLTNALAAIAAGVALDAAPAEMAERASLGIGFSSFRGERLQLRDGIVLVNDCYNANPVSMRAALDHLMTLEAPRRLAVLGKMGELGPGSRDHHREVGEHARAVGVDLLLGVGEEARDYGPDELVADPVEAAELLAAQLEPNDVVLVKGSRAAGLEQVAAALLEIEGAA